MKKTISIVVLSLMFSLQVFQLCDESHDACEALTDTIQVISHKNFSYTAPAPVDDPDASLPLAVGQTLDNGKAATLHALVSHPLVLVPLIHAASVMSQITTRDRSPPWARLADTAPPLISILLASTPARPLAPPLS